MLHPIERAADVLAFYRGFARSCPEELSTVAALLTGPGGDAMVATGVCWSGSPAAGERVLEPLRTQGSPVADLIRRISYVEMQSLLDEAWPPGRHHYWKSSFLQDTRGGSDRGDDPHRAREAVATLGDRAATAARGSGACRRRTRRRSLTGASTGTSVSTPCGPIPPTRTANVAWARDGWQAMRPYLEPAVYSNNLGDEGDDRVQEAYGRQPGPTRSAQDDLRPGQRLPPQPERPAAS